MAVSIKNSLLQAIAETENTYHRLILLVGESNSGKTQVLNDLGKEINSPILNLNLLLSKQLLEMTHKQRALELPKLFEDAIKQAGDVIILDNIEMLFDPSLKQDPLKLLLNNSRNITVISSWSGKQEGSKLIYAEVGHPEYRSYPVTDFITINTDGTTNINLET